MADNNANGSTFAIGKRNQHSQKEDTNQSAARCCIYEHWNFDDTREHAHDVRQSHADQCIRHTKNFDGIQLLGISEFAKARDVNAEILPWYSGDTIQRWYVDAEINSKIQSTLGILK